MVTSASSDRLTPDEPPMTIVHYEPNHATSLLQSLHNGQYTDITLKVDGISIKAHRTILMASSKYFAKMLKDAKTNVLELFDCPSTGLVYFFNRIIFFFLKFEIRPKSKP